MANQGILQAQINIKNKIDLNNAFSSDTIQNPLLKSIEGNLNLKDKNSLVHFNGGNNATQHIDPIIYEDSDELDITNALNNNASVKYLKIDANIDSTVTSKFANNSSLEKIDSMFPIEAGISAFENTNLKQIPNATFNNPDQSNVLTNDSNLSPTTLDFSDKNNMTRLGVYGEDSDEISNLQFVKVSTEAPFDGNSPQINVSYTGLSRSALVNLFKSMPYNVGYTVVGSPTITDGVASGFSSDNYLKLQNQFGLEAGEDFEFFTKFVCPNATDISNSRAYLWGLDTTGHGYGEGIYINGSLQPMFALYTLGGFGSGYTLTAGNSYYIKAGRTNGQTYIGISTDNSNWTIGNGDSDRMNDAWTAHSASALPTIGRSVPDSFAYTCPFPASIDLNNTYIKKGGLPWFRGTAAMTKTCDVHGCTGTADLTADDKAIATNKGWTLVTTAS